MNVFNITKTGEFPINRIFISYKTRDHLDVASEINNLLKSNNYHVWIDKDQKGLPEVLFLFCGLDYFIFKGINESDIVLFLSPQMRWVVLKK